MRKNHIIVFTFLIELCLAICSCRQKVNIPSTKITTLSHESFEVHDSLKVYNDSISFEYFVTDRWPQNQLLGFQLPILNLSVIDTLGNIRQEISRAGLKEQQFRAQFIDAKWFNGRMYVLAQGNYFSLSIYDKDLKFIKKIHLSDIMGDNYAPVKTCSFAILKGSNGNIRVFVSSGDKRYNFYTSKYYKKAYGLMTFELDSQDQIVNTSNELRLRDFQTIENALSTNRRNWNTPNVMFACNDTLLYVKPVFDNNIYVYNNTTFNLLKIFTLPIPANSESNYTLPFDLELKYNSDTQAQVKIQYTNIKYVDFKYSKGSLYLMFILPVPLKSLPKNPNDVGSLKLNSTIYKINLADKRIKSYTFNSKYNPYSFYLKEPYLLLGSDSELTDSPYLYSIKLN
ncbi:hypothetical protein [Mucilaginibacter sp. FT3.2]|uniref:hypothetical protein n=1 Tax=Mucilaginibacter sp. FT3.2 TaxID=2723090 RepID=UPI00160CFD12|nr:hypothetical protein [Mucilaginibacter sp. FT3.2]MBB6232727.1 hypothetical protein [Mucilaginibacter sp. FT3.2]